MRQSHSQLNPFGLLLDSEPIIRAVESSERLSRLHSRICHPLDEIKPKASKSACAQFDRWIDQLTDEAARDAA